MYTIGQIAEMYQIPASTLRYYDKEGLFPHMERRGNIRYFGEKEIRALRIIECLKRSGLEIKDIRRFFQWAAEGPSTYADRKELFDTRIKVIEQEMEELQHTLSMLKFKQWYYEQAMLDGNEDRLRAMMPDGFPPEIQELYDLGVKCAPGSQTEA